VEGITSLGYIGENVKSHESQVTCLRVRFELVESVGFQVSYQFVSFVLQSVYS
jgi:hypothetical protein